MSLSEILKSMKGVPRLENSNYDRWSTHFLDALSILDIDRYVLKTVTELKSRGAEDIPKSDLTAHKQDKIIRAAISQLVPDIVFHLVDASFTSKKCWDNLKQFYRPNSTEDVDDLLQEFWGLEVDDEISVDEFMQKLAEIRIKINLINSSSTPSDSSIKKRILNHFMKCSGGFYMSTAISLMDASVSLQSSLAAIRASQGVYQELNPTSIVALVQDSGSDSSSKVRICAHCNRRGHLRESCFLWLDTPDGTKWAAKNPQKATKIRKLQEKLARRKEVRQSKDVKSLNPEVDNEITQSGAWIMEEFALLTAHPDKGYDVVLDTGATNHIFNDRSMFTSMVPCEKNIINASGQLVPVSGIGSAQFQIFDYVNKNSSKIITMENVWYVPSCTKNLVSGVQLFANGFIISSSNGGLSVVTKNGGIIATARPKGGLFSFNTSPSSYTAPSSTYSLNQSDVLLSQNMLRLTNELVHQRFAHVGTDILSKLNVSDLDLVSLRSKDIEDFRFDKRILHSCNVCNLCKRVEKINRGPVSVSLNLLDLVHSDTWGKCRVPGIFGSLYFVTFTDDYSKESEVFMMKSKKEVPRCFQLYMEKKERQTGKTIKAMRFDGGSEYKTINFKGIIKQISAPYTQHQNGVAERLNRSLITMVRCMLSQAKLPLRFWDAAVLTACYLRNRLPSNRNDLTPFELMSGRHPRLSHLKVWGCVCYALIDDKDPQRFKLSPTSHKGIFIGYCESSTQYRVYIPSKNGLSKTITSANVYFLEDTFWDWNGTAFEVCGGDASFSSQLITDSFDTESEESDSEVDCLQTNNGQASITPSSDSSDSTETSELLPISPQSSNVTEPSMSAIEGNNNLNNTESISETDETSLRRSSRVRKPIEPRSAWRPRNHVLHIEKDVLIPQTYLEAINGPDRKQWTTAINDELASLKEKNVFENVGHIPHGRKPIGSRWVFAVKSDGRFKARLVAKGFSQTSGIDYFDTYAPTLRMDSLRTLLAVAAFRDWEIHQVDVKTAYLEGDLHEEIFMRCPEGMKGSKYVRVKKALYGLKQSGRAWNEKLDIRLTSLGFKKSEYDHCVYIHLRKQIVIGVYVDNLIICGKMIKQVEDTKYRLSSFFRIKDLGVIDMIIGWKITRERETRTLRISQAQYLAEKIKSFGLENSISCSSPLSGYDGILPGRESEDFADESAYASAIGSLGYASNSTRPDISFATCQLGKFNSSPVARHWDSVCRVFRYIKGSVNNLITYSFGPLDNELSQELKAIAYSDSDFASDSSTRCSVSGYIFMLGGGPICWQSKRQKSISTSTAEAEYVALCEASKQAIWVTGFLKELHIDNLLIDDGGILVYCDNQSAIAIAKGANSTKTKHIDIAYHFSRDCINSGKIKVKYIPTSEMLADILTKPLQYPKAKPLHQTLFK